jgi:hypothetical protein
METSKDSSLKKLPGPQQKLLELKVQKASGGPHETTIIKSFKKPRGPQQKLLEFKVIFLAHA